MHTLPIISYPTRTRGIIVKYFKVIHHFISQCSRLVLKFSQSAVKNSLEKGLSKHIYDYLVFLQKAWGKRGVQKNVHKDL